MVLDADKEGKTVGKCPVCNGTGEYILDDGFIDIESNLYETETCDKCLGTGVIKTMNLSNIKYVADNMKQFIEKKLMKVFMED